MNQNHIGQYAYFQDTIRPITEANLNIASAANLYGLSVYSVLHAHHKNDSWLLFRLQDHLDRLFASAKMIGFTLPDNFLNTRSLSATIGELLRTNNCESDQFVRITIHATSLLPGIKTSDLTYHLSLFTYKANPILPKSGARIKTSLWRRTADTAIPARAKVNGAYVNSALAKQDALDSGYDDCLFLNQHGLVSELSAANICMIKNNRLYTPDVASDILEGITRRSVIDIASEQGIPVIERPIALTELYTADELFACGTSAFISPILEIDNREINAGEIGPVTKKIQKELTTRQTQANSDLITSV